MYNHAICISSAKSCINTASEINNRDEKYEYENENIDSNLST